MVNDIDACPIVLGDRSGAAREHCERERKVQMVAVFSFACLFLFPGQRIYIFYLCTLHKSQFNRMKRWKPSQMLSVSHEKFVT